MTSKTVTQAPKENLLLNLACNIAAPAIVLAKFSKPEWLGAKTALLVALAFPLAYGIYDLIKRRRFNFISALGFASTLATGGLSLFKLEPFWFAVKEAVVPSLIGLTILVSQWTRKPLVRTMLFNDQMIDVPRVEAALSERNQQPAFNRLLKTSSWLLAASSALSAILNFGLARYLITAMPDTPEFNEQLGKMTWMSWPVIALPSLAFMMYALWRLLSGIKELTGLALEDIMHQPPAKQTTAPLTDAVESKTDA